LQDIEVIEVRLASALQMIVNGAIQDDLASTVCRVGRTCRFAPCRLVEMMAT